MKNVLVIFTGGTISMERSTNQSVVISNGPEEVLNLINNSKSDIQIESKELFMKPSPSITLDDMLTIAKFVEENIKGNKYDGIVITHGTDTIEETAYFLDLYIKSEKPVVLTGSMRNISELGYDGPANLASSILVAASKYALNKGVLLVMNGEINSAREVTKTHTVALDTFKSLEFGPLGVIDSDNVIFYRDIHLKGNHIHPNCIEKKVEIVKAYSDASSKIINFLINDGVKGIIIEGLGRGNVPPMMLDGIKNAISKGIPVVLTSRCVKGRVLDTYGYPGGGHNLKELGVIFGENLNSQKARIKLVLALGISNDIDYLKKIYEL